MNPDAIIAAGVRNRAARLGQIERLQPNAATARQKREELTAQREALKPARQGFETMQRFKHVPNFFPTPRHIVQRMIDLADIRATGTHYGEAFNPTKPAPLWVLEPSAGKGDIAHAVAKLGHCVRCIEFVDPLASLLASAGLSVRCADFLELTPADFSHGFDRVIMNPPFERGSDFNHVRHAFTFLRPGGRLVAVVCNPTGSKLDQWIQERGLHGRVENLPDDTFRNSERPTGVRTSLVIVDRPNISTV